MTEAEQSLMEQRTLISFVGHSHKPNFYYMVPNPEDDGEEITFISPGSRHTERCKRVLVNVGSVGQPRDEDPRAAYAIYDADKRWVAIRRVPYDWEKTRRKIIAAGLPQVLGDRLRLGV